MVEKSAERRESIVSEYKTVEQKISELRDAFVDDY